MGFMGFVFLLGIIAGVVWLGMVIFQLGPYHSEEVPVMTTPTNPLPHLASPKPAQQSQANHNQAVVESTRCSLFRVPRTK